MRHVVENLHAKDKAVVTYLLVKVKNRCVVDLNLVFEIELLMILHHQLFAPVGQLGGYLNQNILATLVESEVVVFEVVQDGVRHGACARANLEYLELLYFSIFHLVCHEVGNSVPIEWLEQLRGCQPGVFGVVLLHGLTEVIVAD